VNLGVGEADHPTVLVGLQPSGAFGIIGCLIGVRVPVNFDNDFGLRAVKVDDEVAHGILAAKLVTIELSAA
jgi:hypothetical protein